MLNCMSGKQNTTYHKMHVHCHGGLLYFYLYILLVICFTEISIRLFFKQTYISDDNSQLAYFDLLGWGTLHSKLLQSIPFWPLINKHIHKQNRLQNVIILKEFFFFNESYILE